MTGDDSRPEIEAHPALIDLRNRVADHEMHIVRFYVKRGAYVAAAKRAEQVVTQYPGAPASLEALQLLQESYRSLHLTQQADDAGRLYAALSKQKPVNDYPRTLPATIQDAGNADRPVEDSSWLQRLLGAECLFRRTERSGRSLRRCLHPADHFAGGCLNAFPFIHASR